MVERPPPRHRMVYRPSGRVILADPAFDTLLIRGVDPIRPDRGGFWWTPGGACEGNESVEDCARRELEEETGITVEGDLGPAVLVRTGTFPLGDTWYDSHETFFFVLLDERVRPDPIYLEPAEAATITTMAWRAIDELRRSADPVYPRCLPELLEFIRGRGRPPEPWREES